MEDAGLKPGDLGTQKGLMSLPPLTRRDVQAAGNDLFCTQVPQLHGPVRENTTSGSTGEPVRVRKTEVTQLFWMANTLREHAWQERDVTGRLQAIMADVPGTILDDWSAPVNLLYKSGPLRITPITLSIEEQLNEVLDFKPDVLMTYPNNLSGLIDECEKRGLEAPPLKHLWCISESVPQALRKRAKAFFGVPIEDNYSSTEMGIMALQCKKSGHYHVMSESLLVEVLDDNGQHCKPGETGRVVVTDLHNFATPLIRYEIADYAEVAKPCACGRGLATLSAIHGRSRNLMTFPDGSRSWPVFTHIEFREVAPVSQFQIIQHDVRTLEVKLVATRAVTQEEEKELVRRMHKTFSHPFDIRFTYLEGRIEGRRGKFEEFISLVSA